jgi:hypothetical protein
MPSAVFTPLPRALVAILRGIRPEEIEAVVAGSVEAGFGAIEIPVSASVFVSCLTSASECQSRLMRAAEVVSCCSRARLRSAALLVSDVKSPATGRLMAWPFSPPMSILLPSSSLRPGKPRDWCLTDLAEPPFAFLSARRQRQTATRAAAAVVFS